MTFSTVQSVTGRLCSGSKTRNCRVAAFVVNSNKLEGAG
jgi:hypothetical protein